MSDLKNIGVFFIKIQEVLTEKQLAGFVGGYSDKDCLMDIGKSSEWNVLSSGKSFIFISKLFTG